VSQGSQGERFAPHTQLVNLRKLCASQTESDRARPVPPPRCRRWEFLALLREDSRLTHPPGHLWRDKRTALSGPLSSCKTPGFLFKTSILNPAVGRRGPTACIVINTIGWTNLNLKLLPFQVEREAGRTSSGDTYFLSFPCLEVKIAPQMRLTGNVKALE